ncbi:MAG: dihydrolipoamide acetyltransferase family protein [Candidatus Dormibacteria bacterium]
MAYQVTMPQMGYDMTEGTINRWLVEEGTRVERGDTIASIATDKADIDIEAYASGILRRILVGPGGKVPVGAPIAVIAEEGEELEEGAPAAGGGEEGAAPPPPEAASQDRAPQSAAPEPTPVPDWAHQLGGQSTMTEEPPPVGRVKASPLARRRARELGLPLSQVRGTGPEGRVTAEDVEALAQSGGLVAGAPTAAGRAAPLDPTDPSEPVKTTRMREAIARRMSEANSTIPHFYLTTRVDVAALMRLRSELNSLQQPGVPRFSVTDFLVRAMALTLQRHPQLNSAYVGGGVRRFFSSNIALAVAVPDGLVAPTLRSCESLSFAELARRTHDLAARAKSNQLRPEELAGAHTAISNLGMFGINQFSAIITPGQGSVLAVGEVGEVPVVRDGQVVAGQIMEMTLAIDHRVTDGAQGAEALGYLRWCLEHPASLLI